MIAVGPAEQVAAGTVVVLWRWILVAQHLQLERCTRVHSPRHAHERLQRTRATSENWNKLEGHSLERMSSTTAEELPQHADTVNCPRWVGRAVNCCIETSHSVIAVSMPNLVVLNKTVRAYMGVKICTLGSYSCYGWAQYLPSTLKILYKSAHKFLSYLIHRQRDRHTNTEIYTDRERQREK